MGRPDLEVGPFELGAIRRLEVRGLSFDAWSSIDVPPPRSARSRSGTFGMRERTDILPRTGG